MLSIEELKLLENIIKVKFKGEIVFENLNNLTVFGDNAKQGDDCIGDINSFYPSKRQKISCNS